MTRSRAARVHQVDRGAACDASDGCMTQNGWTQSGAAHPSRERKRPVAAPRARAGGSVSFHRGALCVGTGRRAAGQRRGYVLLETTIATGILIVGLAVIGAQVQDADRSVHTRERKLQAILLAERQLAELEMGLVELDSVDEIEDGDFGPRYPDYGWLLTTENTALEQVYLLKLEVLHHFRDEAYQEDEFDFDAADTLFTVYTMRSLPQPVSFSEDFGFTDEELLELGERFDELAIEGLDVESFDPRILQTIDLAKVLEALPVIMDALGMDITQLTAALPPDMIRQLEESGLLSEEGVSGILDSLGESEEPR